MDPNHDYYPSIEHIIPVSKGGTHTWDNVKLDHRKCNYLKSNEMI
ncbi:HNH endonuclease [Bacillus cereus]